jgi:hypothetical protein
MMVLEWFEQGLSLQQGSRAFMTLLGISLSIQTLEYLVVARRDQVMRWDLQWHETPERPSWLRPLLRWLFQSGNYTTLLVLRLLLAVLLLAGWHGVWLSVPLMGIAVLLLFRWRGAFNGGSDFMTLVALSALLLSDVLRPWWGTESAWRAAMWWVSLQLVTSYFMSGWVKLKNAGWRQGLTLPVFLDTGIYGPLPEGSLFRRPMLAAGLSWAFILWEGLFVLVYLDVRLAWVACAIGTVFHFLVYWYFGLNRFFWAWLTTYPALLCTVTEWTMSHRF